MDFPWNKIHPAKNRAPHFSKPHVSSHFISPTASSSTISNDPRIRQAARVPGIERSAHLDPRPTPAARLATPRTRRCPTHETPWRCVARGAGGADRGGAREFARKQKNRVPAHLIGSWLGNDYIVEKILYSLMICPIQLPFINSWPID